MIDIDIDFKNIVDSSPTGFHFWELIDDELVLIGFNKAASDILKIDHSKLLGLKIEDAFSGLKNTNQPILYKKIAIGEVNTFSFENYYKDDRINGYYKMDVFSNKKNFVCVSFMDITELKKLEMNLIKAKEKAEESERLKTSFLASMSHEIRTPMNGIIGFADLLKENNINEEDQKNYIEIIKKSGKRMLNILNNIISISKIDAGVEKVNNDATDINSLLKYIYDFFKIEVENKGLKLILNEKLEKENSLILTDREKIYSILINLVKNSIKYSDKGKIWFGCNKVGDNLIFYVKDQGVGIPKKDRETIFNIFTQLKNSDGRKKGGIGLGLTISKKYVEMLGGKIWIDTETKKGTKFYFSIPYVKVDDIEDEMEEKLEYTKILKNKKFLIVENDETSMLLLSTIIKKYGGKVIKVYNGLDAIDICRRNNDIDLIFMDIHIPEINGYETTKEIRLFNNDVIIIAQTAYALEGDESLAKTSGCNEYISKPISIEDVRNIIEKYLNVEF